MAEREVKSTDSIVFDWGTITDPHAHLLSTNDSPSEDEVASLQQRIVALKARILQCPLESDLLQEILRLSSCALSPIRRIPPEVLCEILAHLTNEKDLANAALACRAWRATSLLTPAENRIRFWSDIGIPCADIRSWLGRVRHSQSKKLELVQGSRCYCSCWQPATKCCWTDRTFLSLLPELCSASVQLSLDVTSPLCIYNLVDAIHSLDSTQSDGSESIKSAWHTLRSLKLRMGRSVTQPSDAQDPFIFNHLPMALESLAITLHQREVILSTVAVITIPAPLCTSITDLTLDCDNTRSRDLFNLLRQLVNIEILRLNAELVEWPPVPGAAVVLLPKVHTLELHDLFYHDNTFRASNTFRAFRLPSLTSLTLENPRLYDSSPSTLRSFMHDDLCLLHPGVDSPRVRCLKIITRPNRDAAHLESEVLSYVLEGLPYLETLVLWKIDFSPTELYRLERLRIKSNDAPPILPRLRLFELRSPGVNFQMKKVLEYLELRGTRFREYANLEHSENDPLWVKIQYRDWSEETKADWAACSDLVRKLKQDFGVTVERIVGDDEWEEYGKAGFGAS
ncbi:hypothetical protein NMY22_g12561 [Coprinellus aureogranulatus]|nr:hypothetical protein NMY22_g12561 [Coprinellus aureogranulatus]